MTLPSKPTENTLLEPASLAHQLLTPITAAGNYAAALLAAQQTGTLSPEKLQEGLRRLLNETARARDTAQALKRLFRADHPTFEAIEAETLLNRAVARVNPARIVLRIPTAAPSIVCDAGLIEEALVNLLFNAVASAAPHPVCAGFALQEEALNFFVTNPVPDAQQALKTMQTPGKSTTPGGTGLGLLLVRRILAAHRSTLQLRAENHTLTVSFTLRNVSTPKTLTS